MLIRPEATQWYSRSMPLLDRCLKGGTELANLANSASASMSNAYVPSDQGRFRVSRTRWWAYTHAPHTSALPASRGRGELPILGHRSRQTPCRACSA
jgi:hypothetical protein